jgi:hypothetical protein
MSMMRVEIEADTYFASLAALREQHKVSPDKRFVAALVDLHAAALKEVDREIAAVADPPYAPALVRKQAG